MQRTTMIVGASLLFGLGLIGLWALASRPSAADRAPLEYVTGADASSFVEIPRLGILTSENFVGHRIRVIEGTVQNVSETMLRSIELRLQFKGREGETVLESSEEALRTPLPPGEARRFEFRFENLPQNWDFRVPEVEIARIGY